MKKKILLVALLALFTINLKSQIRDISLTVSPVIEHTWWDNNLTLDNSTFWGARVGFGFGPIFEIRGYYLQSLDTKALLRDINWEVTNGWADKMNNSHVDINRYGGEFKFNLMKNTFFAPYITAGGGVQNIKYKMPSATLPNVMTDMKEEQLFGALGLGTKFNLSNRIVLSLEAKNTFFNVDKQSYYLSPNFSFDNNKDKRLYNWSALASLDFYLGGVTYDDPNSVASAYNNLFSDGFSGMKFVLEPGGTYVDFNDNLPFADQYFLGGAAGVDFSSLVGIRGFYYQATKEPKKLSFSFNDQLSMYGGNIIARLNQPRGVNPYLNIGAGYLQVGTDYNSQNLPNNAKSTPFVFGGIGIEIPLSPYVAIYGTYNAMFTSQKGVDVAQLERPSQIETSTMYQAGVRFNIGKRTDANATYQSTIDRAVGNERELNNERIDEIRRDYQARIDELNTELDEATRAKDYETATLIMEEKKNTEEVLKDIDEETKEQPAQVAQQATQCAQTVQTTEKDVKESTNLIRMTEEDFERLVNKVVKETRKDINYNRPNPPRHYNQECQPYQQPQYMPQQPAPQQPTQYSQNPALNQPTTDLTLQNRMLTDRLTDLENKLDRNFSQINNMNSRQSGSTVVVSDAGTATVPNNVSVQEAPAVISQAPANTDASSSKVEKEAVATSTGVRYLKINRLAPYVGLGFGDLTSFHAGIRAYMQISTSNFDFVPEFYTALGSKSNGFGLSGNVIYNLEDYIPRFTPYVGLGLGAFHGKDKTHVGSNIIVGTGFELGNGDIFIDYSVRNLFKQNQLAIGYRFVF